MAIDLFLRQDLTHPLTNTEVDKNFTNLRFAIDANGTDITTLKGQMTAITGGTFAVNSVNGKHGSVKPEELGVIVSINNLHGDVLTGNLTLTVADIPTAAPLDSPLFTGTPTLTNQPTLTGPINAVATVQLAIDAAQQTASLGQDITYISRGLTGAIMIVYKGQLYMAHSPSSTSVTGNGYPAMASLGAGILNNWFAFSLQTTSPVVDVVEVGHGSVVVLTANNELWAWGNNGAGEIGGDPSVVAASGPLGTEARTTPTLIMKNVAKVYRNITPMQYSATGARLFVKGTDNWIYAAGFNRHGALGVGVSNDMSGGTSGGVNWDDRHRFCRVTSLGQDVLDLFPLGGSQGCTFATKLTSGGILIYACGFNGYSSNDAGTAFNSALEPTTFAGSQAGLSSFNYAIGYGKGGQLGIGDTMDVHTFIDVTSSWGGIAAGDVVSMHISGTGRAYRRIESPSSVYSRFDVTVGMLRKTSAGITTFRLSGANTFGQIGNDDNSDTATVKSPHTVVWPGSTDLKQCAIQGGYSCQVLALTNSGQLYGWGDNINHNLGTVVTPITLAPIPAFSFPLHGIDHQLYRTPQLIHVFGSTTAVDSILSDGLTTTNYGWETQTILKTTGVLNMISANSLVMAGYGSDYCEDGTGARTIVPTFQRIKIPFNANTKLLGWMMDTDQDASTVANDMHGGRVKTFIAVSADNRMYVWGADTIGQISGCPMFWDFDPVTMFGSWSANIKHAVIPLVVPPPSISDY
jgi:hypothetical protein